ncbi:MAG: hypothetical protein ACJ76H_07930 [Bacteriovoracaceae bacterium]
MKKIISFVLLFCLSLNVMAGTVGVQKLERQLDDYKFAMTVEWDQKDQNFKDAKTKEFYGALEKIIREDGLSQLEIMALMEKKLVNHTALEALRLKLALLGNTSSPETLAKALESSTKDMYSQGASWNGEVVIPLAIGVIVVAVIAYKWWWEKNHVCAEWQYVDYECDDSYWDDRTCTTHSGTDEDGNSYSYDECSSYWHEEYTTTCGPQNHCVRYEEVQK